MKKQKPYEKPKTERRTTATAGSSQKRTRLASSAPKRGEDAPRSDESRAKRATFRASSDKREQPRERRNTSEDGVHKGKDAGFRASSDKREQPRERRNMSEDGVHKGKDAGFRASSDKREQPRERRNTSEDGVRKGKDAGFRAPFGKPVRDEASKGKRVFSKKGSGKPTPVPLQEKTEEGPSRRTGRFTQVPNYASVKATSPNAKRPETKKPEAIRLNRYVANAGVCSRREADELITTGQISVNGKIVKELGTKVQLTDIVRYGKKVLSPERMVYILLNKPKDYITTTDDPEERHTVLELIKGACEERLYPVGRLDRNTTGLLLLTNDGELTVKLTHPSHKVRKVYQAELDKPITNADFEAMMAGFELEDGFIKPDTMGIITPDAMVVGLEIHSGRNRIVRRMFQHFGYEVVKLDRTVFAGLDKKDLPRGRWRFLSPMEVLRLKQIR